MAFDYNAMRNMANGLLTEFGDKFILKKPNGKPVYNQNTKKTEQTYTEYTGRCVKKTYTAEAIGELSNIINAGDVAFVCIMDDISIIPEETKDKVIFGGITYNIISVATIDPSGKKILIHTLHSRRA